MKANRHSSGMSLDFCSFICSTVLGRAVPMPKILLRWKKLSLSSCLWHSQWTAVPVEQNRIQLS